MTILAAFLAAALTRAELLDRIRAAPATRLDGLVVVIGDCPADMRLEYMGPVASFVSGVCSSLYESERIPRRRFGDAGILVRLGDERTNRTDVIASERRRGDGTPYTAISIPAPGHADLERLRLDVAKAFFLSLKGERVDDAFAARALRRTDPALRAADDEAELAAWTQGRPVEGDDERFIRMRHRVFTPGSASTAEILRYAACLRLHPALLCAPFCGKYDSCTFREAIDLYRTDPRVRIQAYFKRPEVVAYASGRGEALADAARAYMDFLTALAAPGADDENLKDLLDMADVKLNVAFEEARNAETERRPK